MSQLWEYIKIALMNIKSNKGRSILTMLGIIIGISSVIMIISIGNGVKSEITGELNDMAGGQIYIYSQSNENGDYIEFNDYTKDNKFFIEIVSEIRVVYFENNKIYSKVLKETHTLQKHNKEILKLNAGTNIIKCHNCGASVDITKEKCGYCNTELKYIQEWTLITER